MLNYVDDSDSPFPEVIPDNHEISDSDNDDVATEPCPKKILLDVPGPSVITKDSSGSSMTVAAPKLVKSLVIDMRLPNPCPLPTHFTQATSTAIEKNQLIGLSRFRFLREAAEFYFGICPKPTSNEYTDKYPQLKDKQEEYWVNIYFNRGFPGSTFLFWGNLCSMHSTHTVTCFFIFRNLLETTSASDLET